ncbi:tyrosine-type recombinase/integrase [Salinilacihabitans rarus]|uniref:tyrosine-type recombinase/integrase n=1 Tax=Salinilacihabitans rarus TaxID=2961596 RepID=UPI0020C91B6E|nr:site-specific integrase [Salinilacihabitans rarus]
MALEPYAPQEAVTDFLEDQQDGQAKNTVQNYKYALNPFVDWCHENNVENLNDLTGRRLKEFKRWRGQQVQTTTLRNQMWTLKKFMRYCETIEAVPYGLPMKVESLIPAKNGDDSRDEFIEAERAEALLDYLRKYEYASLRHVTFLLLWRTAMRQSSLHALDVDDLVEDPPMLKIRHRPDEGTPLKNKKRGERNVPLSKEDVEVVKDYIEMNHPGETDDEGRTPLLMGRNTRCQKTTIQRNVYTLTRPCHYGQECPHDRDPDECEANSYNTASKCPSSISPHSIRKGRIMYLLDNDVSIEDVSDLVNSGYDTIKHYYDKRSKTEKSEKLRQTMPDC